MSPVKLPTVMSRASTTHFWHFFTYSSNYSSTYSSIYLISRIIRRIRRRIRRMRESVKSGFWVGEIGENGEKIAAAKIWQKGKFCLWLVKLRAKLALKRNRVNNMQPQPKNQVKPGGPSPIFSRELGVLAQKFFFDSARAFVKKVKHPKISN